MNENVVVKTKNSKGLVALVIVLILLVIGMGSYIIYDKVFNVKESDKVVDKKETKKEEQIKISEEELEKYLATVPMVLEDDGNESGSNNDAYSGEKSTMETIDKTTTIYPMVFDKTNKVEDSVIRNSSDSEVRGFANKCTTEEELKNKLKETYDYSELVNEFPYPGGAVKKSSDNLYCTFYGRGAAGLEKVNKIIDYKTDNDELIVLEKAGFVTGEYYEFEVFKTTKKDESVYKYKVDENSELTNASSAGKNYIKENIQDFYTFKHTFKKGSNNNYYWYSTEIEY